MIHVYSYATSFNTDRSTCVPVTNVHGQFHGVRASGVRRLRRLVQPSEQLAGVLRVVVQIVQVHQQQRVRGGPRTESDVHAEDDLHEEELRNLINSKFH